MGFSLRLRPNIRGMHYWGRGRFISENRWVMFGIRHGVGE